MKSGNRQIAVSGEASRSGDFRAQPVRSGLALCALVSLVLLSVAFGGCKPQKGGPPPGMKIPVVVAEVKAETIREEVRSIGDVAADETVELRSEIDGRVERIDFTEGQLVEKGQVLAQIDQEKLSATLAEARANLDLAKANLDRNRELVASKTISRSEFDRAEAEFLAAQANARRLDESLRDARLEAPFGGMIGQRLVSPGQYVQKGQQVSSIVALDPVKVEFPLPERYLSQLQVGQTVDVKVAAYADQTFQGEIFFISPQVDVATRTVLVKARVPNPEMKLRAGMLAEVATVLAEREQALVVPESAIMLQKDAAQVFVTTAAGSVEVRPVELGVQLKGRTEVRSGLVAGELVVSEGTQKIGPGVPVTFTDPNAPSEKPIG